MTLSAYTLVYAAAATGKCFLIKTAQYKQQQVYDVLTRIGKMQLPELSPIMGALETKFYRNKLEYSFSARQFIPEGMIQGNEEKRN